MNLKIGFIAIVLVLLLVFTGLFTFGDILGITVDTSTDNYSHGGIGGFNELLGPNNRKGYIHSYKTDGLSETIVCLGKVKMDTWATGIMTKARYIVQGKTETSGWETLSEPGTTSRYLSNPNPGENIASGIKIGGTVNFKDYSFEVVGNHYKAIRVALEGYIATHVFDFKWRLLQLDEANLYEGWGGLYLPFDEENRPRSTFEIGETVKIRVKTTYGGQAIGEGKTWRVALRDPNGDEVFHKDYGDNVDTGYGSGAFSFDVTESMYSKSSNNRYTIEIYNTLIPKGTMFVNTIDLVANAPGDVEFSGPVQSKVGNSVTIKMEASVNSDLQLAIDHFEVSVIYGTKDVLLPSSPSSDRWIIHTTDVSASGSGSKYTASISFTPEKESYVTVHGKAYDTEGRASKHTETWTLWTYKDAEAPDEVIDDETGQDDYGGGHTDTWLPWDPSGGNWGTISNFDVMGIIIAIVIVAIFMVVGVYAPVAHHFKALIIIIGILLAVATYILFF